MNDTEVAWVATVAPTKSCCGLYIGPPVSSFSQITTVYSLVSNYRLSLPITLAADVRLGPAPTCQPNSNCVQVQSLDLGGEDYLFFGPPGAKPTPGSVTNLYRLDKSMSGYALTGPLIFEGKNAAPVPACVGKPGC